MFLPADSSCIWRVSVHFTQSKLSMSMTAGVVVEKQSEYCDMSNPTGLKVLDKRPQEGGGGITSGSL